MLVCWNWLPRSSISRRPDGMHAPCAARPAASVSPNYRPCSGWKRSIAPTARNDRACLAIGRSNDTGHAARAGRNRRASPSPDRVAADGNAGAPVRRRGDPCGAPDSSTAGRELLVAPRSARNSATRSTTCSTCARVLQRAPLRDCDNHRGSPARSPCSRTLNA
jgi:hypothetical protein